jgi:hypothetical protein
VHQLNALHAARRRQPHLPLRETTLWVRHETCGATHRGVWFRCAAGHGLRTGIPHELGTADSTRNRVE